MKDHELIPPPPNETQIMDKCHGLDTWNKSLDIIPNFSYFKWYIREKNAKEQKYSTC